MDLSKFVVPRGESQGTGNGHRSKSDLGREPSDLTLGQAGITSTSIRPLLSLHSLDRPRCSKGDLHLHGMVKVRQPIVPVKRKPQYIVYQAYQAIKEGFAGDSGNFHNVPGATG